MAKAQLTVSEAKAELEKKDPNKTAEDLKILADSVNKADEEAAKAEPSEDAIARGVSIVLSNAKALAEQGKYSAVTVLPDLNYQGGYRVTQQLKEVHGFEVRQNAVNNRVQIDVIWGTK